MYHSYYLSSVTFLRWRHPISLVAFLTLWHSAALAHDGHSHAPSVEEQKKIMQVNTVAPKNHLVLQRDAASANRPHLAKIFDPFSDQVNVRIKGDFLFVESNGMPKHPMMTGITAWQQQVPIPQDYSGDNAYRIPLHPMPAKKPMSAKTNFFRGAIALAANGIPIFNPIKTNGRTDTFLAGELDQWGGHCGRADDYHYHIAPVHLEKIVGKGNPIAVALDGYPIFGYDDPNGKPPTNLDWLNGHKGPNGEYHYHATKTYPYLNGGFYGQVTENGGQVEAQPRAQGVRAAMPPLRGAKITGFDHPKLDSYVVRYEINGDRRSIEYTIADDRSVHFKFISDQGTTSETYAPRQRGGKRDRRGPESGNPQGQRSDDPIQRVIDSNGDGKLDANELRMAAASIRKLDRNGDNQIVAEELRGPVGPRQSEVSGSRGARKGAPKPGGPPSGDGPRQPWILVHADEIDLDQNKIISRDEIVGEATKAFTGFDVDGDNQLTANELSGRSRSRSAMAGFLKGHAKEIDRDGDGILTKSEAVGNAERMFGKMDRDGDGHINAQEMEASRR